MYVVVGGYVIIAFTIKLPVHLVRILGIRPYEWGITKLEKRYAKKVREASEKGPTKEEALATSLPKIIQDAVRDNGNGITRPEAEELAKRLTGEKGPEIRGPTEKLANLLFKISNISVKDQTAEDYNEITQIFFELHDERARSIKPSKDEKPKVPPGMPEDMNLPPGMSGKAELSEEDKKNEKSAERFLTYAYNYSKIARAIDEEDRIAQALNGMALYFTKNTKYKKRAEKMLEKAVKGGLPDETQIMARACAVLALIKADEKDYKGAVRALNRAPGDHDAETIFIPGEKMTSISEMQIEYKNKHKKPVENDEKEEKKGKLAGLKNIVSKGGSLFDMNMFKDKKFWIIAGVVLVAVAASPLIPASTGVLAYISAVPLFGKAILMATGFFTNAYAMILVGGLSTVGMIGVFLWAAVKSVLFTSSISMILKTLIEHGWNAGTSPFWNFRMTANKRRFLSQNFYSAQPRIELIETHEVFGDSKKAKALIEKTKKLILEGKMSVLDSIVFMEYLHGRDDEKDISGMFRIIDKNESLNAIERAYINVLGAKLALEKTPLEGIKVPNGAKLSNDIALERLDAVEVDKLMHLGKAPEVKTVELYDEVNLLKMEALKRKYEDQDPEKGDKSLDRADEYKELFPVVNGRRESLSPAQKERLLTLPHLLSMGERAYEEGSNPREAMEESKNQVGRESTRSNLSPKSPGKEKPKEPEKFTGDDADEVALNTLLVKKKNHRMTSIDRIELAELYISDKKYFRALWNLWLVPEGNPLALKAALMCAVCSIQIINEPGRGRRPILMKIYLQYIAWRLVGSEDDNAKSWGIWIKHAMGIWPRSEEIDLSFENIVQNYTMEPENSEQRYMNELIEQGHIAMLEDEKIEDYKVQALQRIYGIKENKGASEHLQVNGKTISALLQEIVKKQIKESDLTKSGSDFDKWKKAARKEIVLKKEIEEKKRDFENDYPDDEDSLDDKDSLEGKKKERRRSEIKELEKKAAETSGDFSRGEAFLAKFSEFAKENSSSAEMIRELYDSASFTEYVKLLIELEYGPDELTNFRDNSEFGQMFQVKFMMEWLNQEKGKTSEGIFDVQKEKELLKEIEKLVVNYDPKMTSSLAAVQREAITEVAKYDCYETYQDETGTTRVRRSDNGSNQLHNRVLEIVKKLAGNGMRKAEAQLLEDGAKSSIAEAKFSLSQAKEKSVEQQKKEATKSFAASRVSLARALKIYKAILTDYESTLDEKKEAWAKMQEYMVLWGQDDAKNAFNVIVEKLLAEEETDNDKLGKIANEIVLGEVSISSGNEKIIGGNIVKELLTTANLSDEEKILLIGKSGNDLTDREKAVEIINLTGGALTQEKFDLLKGYLENVVVNSKLWSAIGREIIDVAENSKNPEFIAHAMNLIVMLKKKKEEDAQMVTGVDEATLNLKYDDLKKKKEAALDRGRIADEKNETDAVIERVNRLMEMAKEYNDARDFEKAEEMYTEAIGLINGIFERNMEYAKKDEPLLPVGDNFMKTANDLTETVTDFFREQGKLFEAEMLLARGHKMLAEYYLKVDDNGGAAGKAIEQAIIALDGANTIKPYNMDVYEEKKNVLMLQVLSVETKRDAIRDQIEKKKKELVTAEDDQKNVEEKNKKEIKRIENKLKAKRKIISDNEKKSGGADVLSRELINNRREKEIAELEREMGKIDLESKNAEKKIGTINKKITDLEDEESAMDKKLELAIAKSKAIVKNKANLTEAINYAFYIIERSDYNADDEKVKNAISFIAKWGEEDTTQVQNMLSQMKKRAKNLEGANRYKREAFINKMLLDIYFVDNWSGIEEAVDSVSPKKTSVKVSIFGDEYTFSTAYLLGYLQEKVPDDEKGTFGKKVFGIWKSAVTSKNYELAGAAMRALYVTISAGDIKELASDENFDEDGSIKKDKEGMLQVALRAHLKKENISGDLLEKEEFHSLILDLVLSLRKKDTKWNEIESDNDKLQRFVTEFIMSDNGKNDKIDGKVLENKVRESMVSYRKSFYERTDIDTEQRIRDASGIEERKRALVAKGREEIEDGEPDYKKLRAWGQELLQLGGQSAAENYFLGLSAYEDYKAKKKNSSILKVIEYLDKYLKSSDGEEDEVARELLTQIHKDLHNEVYRGNELDVHTELMVATDDRAAKYFTELCDHNVKMRDKELAKDEKEKDTEKAERYLKNAILASRSAMDLSAGEY